MVTVDASRCTRNRFAGSSCHICQDVCPTQALIFENGTWQTSQCTACGLCVSQCPEQVFQLDAPELFEKADLSRECLVTCKQNPLTGTRAVPVHCLQQFSPLVLAALCEKYKGIALYFCPQLCEACSHHWAPNLLIVQLQRLQLTQLPVKLIRQDVPIEKEDNERRSIFRRLASGSATTSKNMVAQALEPYTALLRNEETSSLPPIGRDCLTRYYDKHRKSLSEETPLSFRNLSCDNCSFCGACTAICPHNALFLEDTDTGKALCYQPEQCTGCGLCIDICMTKALSPGDALTVSQLGTRLTLAVGTEHICESCGHRFYSSEESEKTCRFCK